MKLDDLKKLCDEATPGPWAFEREAGVFSTTKRNGAGEPAMVAFEVFSNDGSFITAARTALPKLIAVAEAAKEMHAKVWPEACDPDQVHAAIRLMEALAALEAE